MSKLFMPSNSTNKFLIAPIRAVRNFRRHLHSIFYQEPFRNLLGAYILPRLLGTLRTLGLLGPLRLLRLLI
jgi:hypothetical protein